MVLDVLFSERHAYLILWMCQCIYTYKFPWKCVLICCGFSVPYRSFEETARAPRRPGERDGISLPFSFQRSLSQIQRGQDGGSVLSGLSLSPLTSTGWTWRCFYYYWLIMSPLLFWAYVDLPMILSCHSEHVMPMILSYYDEHMASASDFYHVKLILL